MARKKDEGTSLGDDAVIHPKTKRHVEPEQLPQIVHTSNALWRRSTSRKGITLMCPKCAVAPARHGKDFRYGGRSFKIRFGPGVEIEDTSIGKVVKNKDVAATEYTAYVKCNNGCMFTFEEFKDWITQVTAPTSEEIAYAKSKEPRGGAEQHGPLPGSPFGQD